MNSHTPREPYESKSQHDPAGSNQPNLVLKELRLSLTPSVWLALIGLLSSVLGTAGYIISVLAR